MPFRTYTQNNVKPARAFSLALLYFWRRLYIIFSCTLSKDFGVPQSRKRVYIVGYLRDRCAGERLSFTDTNGASLEQVLPGPEGCRVYSPAGVSITLTSTAGGFGGRSGLYDVSLPIKVMTKSGYQLAHPGDSIDLAYTHFVLISGLQFTLLKSIFFFMSCKNCSISNFALSGICASVSQDGRVTREKHLHFKTFQR